MSKELRMGINAVSFNNGSTMTIDQAVKANVSFVYNIADEGIFNGVNASIETDEKVKKLVELSFMSYFSDVLSKVPRVQWPMCGDEVEKYIKEKMIQVGVEIEAFHLQSINDDPEYKKRMEAMQEEMLNKMKGSTVKKEEAPEPEPVASAQPAPTENSNPLANGMDIKKILTIVVVIILLIVGYFMK